MRRKSHAQFLGEGRLATASPYPTVFMNLNQILKSILKVKANSRVCILLELNDDYSILIEGSFSVNRGSEKVVESSDYIESNFSSELLKNIQSSLENTNISEAYFSDQSGKLTLELENGVTFESFFGEDDYVLGTI